MHLSLTRHFSRKALCALFTVISLIFVSSSPSYAALDVTSGPASGGTTVTMDGLWIKQVATGERHSLLLMSNGFVFAWGNNQFGQLGNGTTTDSLFPTQVVMADNVPLTGIVEIASGWNFNLALAGDGTVYSWGINQNGQLGNGTASASVYATEAQIVKGTDGTGSLTNIATIAAGRLTSYAVSQSGVLYAWGSNSHGQLGDTANGAHYSPFASNQQGGEPLPQITKVAANAYSALALDVDGKVWSMGSNGNGQRGFGTTSNSQYGAKQVTTVGGTLPTIIGIGVGEAHGVAVSSAGKVYAWGYGADGRLGQGTDSADKYYATLVLDEDGYSFSSAESIFVGESETFAKKSNGTLWGWGRNTSGVLGTPLQRSTATNPRLIPTLGGDWNSISLNHSHTLAVDANDQLYGFGENDFGKLGTGDTSGEDGTTYRYTPIPSVSVVGINVEFGNNSATNQIYNSRGWSAVSPAGAAGTTVDIVMTAQLRTSIVTAGSPVEFYTGPGSFTYAAAEQVQSTPQISAPTNTISPSISGKAKVKQTLTASNGTWTGDPTITYQWYRCNKAVKGGLTSLPTKVKCTDIAGATSSTYKLTKKDKSKYVLVVVKGKNSAGALGVTAGSTKKVKK